jgi:prolyl oligopeptidase PreP (S9A serine peptidase family)
LWADVDHDPHHRHGRDARRLRLHGAGDAPILLRVYVESGHGGGRLTSQEVEQNTELLVFFARYLGLPL